MDVKESKTNMGVHYSSESNEWATPMDFFGRLDNYFGFDLDPCCTPENAKAKNYFTMKENGLVQPWSDFTVFMNPPYGREIGTWVRKAYQESLKGATVVCLIPSRTDTAWWHDYVSQGTVVFLRGRIKFVQEGKGDMSAPFPSCLVLFTPANKMLIKGMLLRNFIAEYNKSVVDKRKKTRKLVTA